MHVRDQSLTYTFTHLFRRREHQRVLVVFLLLLFVILVTKPRFGDNAHHFREHFIAGIDNKTRSSRLSTASLFRGIILLFLFLFLRRGGRKSRRHHLLPKWREREVQEDEQDVFYDKEAVDTELAEERRMEEGKKNNPYDTHSES